MGHRIQFEFNDTTFARFDDIEDYTGRTSKSEIVREALRLYEEVAATAHKGGTLAIFHGDVPEHVTRAADVVIDASWLA